MCHVCRHQCFHFSLLCNLFHDTRYISITSINQISIFLVINFYKYVDYDDNEDCHPAATTSRQREWLHEGWNNNNNKKAKKKTKKMKSKTNVSSRQPCSSGISFEHGDDDELIEKGGNDRLYDFSSYIEQRFDFVDPSSLLYLFIQQHYSTAGLPLDLFLGSSLFKGRERAAVASIADLNTQQHTTI
jgi:hypothetical protein